MQEAIDEARLALAEGGIPIGSAIDPHGRTSGRGHHRRVQKGSAILHGEMDTSENAGRQPASAYRDAALHTPRSPCAMRSGATLLYGIPRVVIGENQTFRSEEALLAARGVEVRLLQSPECRALMQRFIASQPDSWNEDRGISGEPS